MNLNVIAAVFKRNFISYFSNLTGYVFICGFALATCVAAFAPNEFFNSNLANFDQLNKFLPVIMLVFIPAITMSIWADERRQGTDELLLTIPAADFDVVLGKYLAAAAIFSVSLLFSIYNFGWLLHWGNPDWRLFLSNYFGYWLVGLAMLSIGMVASFLTNNLTVGFVFGVLFNIPLVMFVGADAVLPARMASVIKQFSIAEQFRDFGRGVISLSSVVYFVLIIVAMMYLCMVLIGRRHWWGGRDGHSLLGHYLVRAVALLAASAGLIVICARLPLRMDMTSERLNSLSSKSIDLVRNLKIERPVTIDAYVSPDVPEVYVQTRLNLLSTLRELAALSGNKISVRLHSTEPLSEEASFAEQQFGIKSQQVISRSRGTLSREEIYLGLAVTSGLNKVVVPFVGRGTPIEYELIRSVSTVTQQDRKRIGVVTTDAKLFGGFDMQTMGSRPNEAIISELEKQYEVVQVSADSPITEKYDVLLAVQPSSLTQEQIEHFVAAVRRGQPTAIFEDPFVYIDSSVPGTAAPRQPPGGMNPFQQRQPPIPKGSIEPLWSLLGVSFSDKETVWQDYFPYPKLSRMLPRELSLGFVFVGPGEGISNPFNNQAPLTSKLQEMLFLFPGSIGKTSLADDIEFTELVMTGEKTGTLPADQIMEQSFMGPGGISPALPLLRKKSAEKYVLAAQIKGKVQDDMAMNDEGAPEKKGDKKKGDKKKGTEAKDEKKSQEFNVILVADIDCLFSAFFQIRQQGEDEESEFNLNLDNVPFVLNVLDTLAEDNRFIDIRKRRPPHRTLTAIEERTDDARQAANDATLKFKDEFERGKDQEQKNFDKEIERVKNLKDVDEVTKARMVAIAQEVGQKRLQGKTAQLERKRDQEVKKIERNLQLEVQHVQNFEKTLAIAFSWMAPVLMGLVVYINRRSHEHEGVAKSRLR